jgi:hypothetical protein
MSSDGLTIGPVLLLMEMDKTVVVKSVANPTSDAFALNKDVIVAYRYISRGAQTPHKSSAGLSAPGAAPTSVYRSPTVGHGAPNALATPVRPQRTLH